MFKYIFVLLLICLIINSKEINVYNTKINKIYQPSHHMNTYYNYVENRINLISRNCDFDETSEYVTINDTFFFQKTGDFWCFQNIEKNSVKLEIYCRNRLIKTMYGSQLQHIFVCDDSEIIIDPKFNKFCQVFFEWHIDYKMIYRYDDDDDDDDW